MIELEIRSAKYDLKLTSAVLKQVLQSMHSKLTINSPLLAESLNWLSCKNERFIFSSLKAPRRLTFIFFNFRLGFPFPLFFNFLLGSWKKTKRTFKTKETLVFVYLQILRAYSSDLEVASNFRRLHRIRNNTRSYGVFPKLFKNLRWTSILSNLNNVTYSLFHFRWELKCHIHT